MAIGKYFPEFEGLRGFMALWVVMGHVANKVGVYYDPGLPLFWKLLVLTNIPVNIFIALSGFAIFTLLGKGSNHYGAYMAGRFFRIYPAYLVCLLLGILLLNWRQQVPAFGDAAWVVSVKDPQLSESILEHFWAHILAHFSLLHGVIPDQWVYGSGHAFVAPAWSLSLEWQFYIVAPLMFWLFHKSLILSMILGGLLIGAGLLMKSYGYTFSYGAFLPLQIGFFYAGMGVYFFVVRNFPALCSCVLLAAVYCVCAESVKMALFMMLLWVLVSAMVVLPSARLGSIRYCLNNYWAGWLGRLSYPVYICHIFMLDLVVWGLAHFASVPQDTLTAFAIILAPTLVATFLLATLIHIYIEKPFMLIGKRFRA